MTIYQEMQDIAADVLNEFKQGVIEFGRVTPGNGPVDNPGPSSTVWTPYDGTARGVRSKYVEDGLAVASDLQTIMPAKLGIVPHQRDFVRIDGVPYKIVHVIAKPEAGTAVVYTLIIRK